ncbi:biotin holocarboxylase synthetase, partial [Steccherinum ochraceum]
QKLVFVQYLVALAVVEACRSPAVLGQDGGKVRIKWPNDLYVAEGEKGEGKRKVGGILVHTSFQGGVTTVVIGCGVNVLNTPPVPSLPSRNSAPRPARSRWNVPQRQSWQPLSRCGTRSSQNGGPFLRAVHGSLPRAVVAFLVTITSTTPHKNVRIVGITEDYGLLRTVPERGGGGGQHP